MEEPDLDALGAQYREARDAIAPHRRRQARAERALARTRRSHPPGSPEITAAEAAAEQAAADVRWCQAAMVAAGEAIKGEPFDLIVERNAAHRAVEAS